MNGDESPEAKKIFLNLLLNPLVVFKVGRRHDAEKLVDVWLRAVSDIKF
jgi:hypothetical protein